MDTGQRRVLTSIIRIFDLLLLVISFAAATMPVLAAQGLVSFADFLAIKIKLQNFLVFTALLAVWHAIFLSSKLYDSKRLSSRLSEAIDIVKATSVSASSRAGLGTGEIPHGHTNFRSHLLGMQHATDRRQPAGHSRVSAATPQARKESAQYAHYRFQSSCRGVCPVAPV